MFNRNFLCACVCVFLASELPACTLQRESPAPFVGSAQWDLQPDTIVDDGTSAAELTIIVRRAAGDVWPEARVVVRADTGGVLLEQPDVTDGQGVAVGRVRCRQAGSVALQAEVQDGAVGWPLEGAGHLTCLAANAVPVVALSASHDTGAADLGAPVFLTLRVTDAQGRPLANQEVTLTTARDGDLVAPTTAITDSEGEVRVALTATSLGTATVVAQTSIAKASATVNFVAGAPDMATSTWEARAGTAVADGQSRQMLDLTVRDGTGRLVPYATVAFRSDTPGDVVSPESAATNGDGFLSVALTGTKQGSRQVAAMTHTGSLMTTAVLVAGPADASHSSLLVSPTSLVADGVSQTTLTAIFSDAFGNPVSAQPVTFAISGNTTAMAQAAGATSATGLYSTTATSTVAADKIVTATCGDATLSQPITFLAGAPNLTLSSFTGSTAAVADGNAALVARAHVVDNYYNPVPNIAVALSQTGNSVIVTPASGTTSSTGDFTGALTSMQVQALSYTMACEGQNVTLNANFTVGPPSAATSFLSASPNSALASNGNLQSTIVTVLRDAQGRILGNTPVLFTSPQAQTIVTPRSALTDALGVATSAMGSALAGNSTIVASSGPMALSATVGFAGKSAHCAAYPVLGERPLALTNINPVVDVAAVDFNSDGNADLAVLNAGATGLQIYMGLGNGSFGAAASYATPGSPIRMAVTDINHDGRKDIVVAANSNFFLSLLGGTNGTFGSTNTVAADGTVVGLCTGDLNGDSYNDVVALSSGSPAGFTVALGSGDGTFSSSTFYASSGNLRNCVIADLDLDGHPDLAITNPGNSNVDLWRGSSTGILTYVNSLATWANPNDIQVGLINADGYPDLAITTTGLIQQIPSADSVSIYFGTGSGNFTTAKYINVDAWPHGLKLVDMNGDGALDLVVGTGSYESFTSFSESSSRAINVIPGAGNGNFLPLIRVFRSSVVAQVSVADFDHDGNLDIAYAMPLTDSAAIAFGQGNLAWSKMFRYNHYFLASTTIGSGDFNGDGNMDIVSSYSKNSVQLFLGTGGGNIASPISLPGVVPNKLEVGDFNGDGFTDLAGYQATTSPPTLGYWKGAGNGNFAASTFSIAAPANALVATTSGDVNGDGIKDIIAYLLDSNQVVTVLGSAASPNFATVFSPFPGDFYRCVEFTLVDVDNDGKLDLVGACSKLVVYTGDGSGRFTYSGAFDPNGTTEALFSVSAADTDGDGYMDVVASSPNYIVNYINQKNGTYISDPVLGFPSNFYNISHGAARMADITGDGVLDIVVSGFGLLMVWPGQSNGAFSAPISYPGTAMVPNYSVPSQANDMTFADYDSNGRLDVATISRDGLVVFFNRGCSQ